MCFVTRDYGQFKLKFSSITLFGLRFVAHPTTHLDIRLHLHENHLPFKDNHCCFLERINAVELVAPTMFK